MKKPAAWGLVLLMMLALCACSQQEGTVPEEISTFYEEYLTAWKTGSFADVEPYVYYVSDENRQLAEEFFINKDIAQVESWEQINENLWVVAVYLVDDTEPEGSTVYHFVGTIDGQLKVMNNTYVVPDSLKGDADLSRFTDPNSLGIG